MWLSSKNLRPQMGPGSIKRSRVDFFSFPVCCFVLFLVLDVSSSLKATESTVTETVIPDSEPQYKDLNVTENYESYPNYDPDGLEWLYDITTNFMDLILEEGIPKDVITISEDNNINFDLTNHVSEILGQYKYFVAVCLIIVIFALVMLVAGLCFTCCCCCGSSHSKTPAQNNISKKITFISLLVICGALIIFGGVCVFNSNQRLRDGIQEFPGDMQKSSNNIKTFLDATGEQIDILLSYNFNQFITWVLNELDKCTSTVNNEIERIDTNIKLTGIFEIAASFTEISNDVVWISNFTKKLSSVVKSMSEVIKNLKEAVKTCEDVKIDCKDLQTSIDQFNFPVNVETVNEQIENLNKILKYSNGIEKGQAKFDSVEADIRTKIENGRNKAKTSIKDAADKMKSNADQISVEIKKLESYFPNPNGHGDDETFVDKAQDFVNKYDSYLYNLGLVISSLLFSIVCLLAVGMVFGIFKISILNNIGRIFLLCGTTFMFYFTVILAVVTLAYFLIGMIAQQAVCKSLRDPSDSTFFKLVDKYDLSKSGLNVKVSQVLIAIRSNKSIYNALNLSNQFNLDKLKDYLDEFKEELDKLVNVVNGIHFDQFKMLTDDQANAFKTLQEPQLSNVGNFMDNLKTEITNLKFQELNTVLNKMISEIDKIADRTETLNTLKQTLNEAWITLNKEMIRLNRLKNDISNEKDILENLKEKLKFGKASFEKGRDNTIDNILNVQKFVGVEMPKLFNTTIKELSDKTFKVCSNYIDLVEIQIMNDVGQCGPLGVVYDATLTSACDKIALQMNSFWFVLLWTMLLFLPTAIISAKLASVYKSEAPVKRSGVEAIRISKRPIRKKNTKKTEEIDRIPVAMNRNVNLLSWNEDDITLDKWEQYPPSEQGHGHSSRTQEEYRTPPPYFFTEFNTVDNSPKFHDNIYDELNRWVQYPESTKKSTRF